MTGLIVKDLCSLRKQMKTMLFVALIYVGFMVTSDSIGMTSGVIIMLCVTLPISTFSWDDFTKWDQYARSLPLERRVIVASKYVLAILMHAGAIGIMTLLSAAYDLLWKQYGLDRFQQDVMAVLSIAGVGMILVAILFPLLYKLGVEKARIAMLLVFGAPFAVVLVVMQMDLEPPAFLTSSMFETLARHLPVLLVLFGVLCLLLSFLVSVRIYERKEV